MMMFYEKGIIRLGQKHLTNIVRTSSVECNCNITSKEKGEKKCGF
jgi:hypothetical protein